MPIQLGFGASSLPAQYWDPEGKELDGQNYFAVLGRPRGVIQAYAKLARLRQFMAANRTRLGRAQTLAVDTIIRDLSRSLELIAARAADDATEAAQRALEARRLRPNSPGDKTALASLIVSRAAKGVPPSGEVGVGDISVLSEHPGWRVQELGSTHLVDMTREKNVRGFFQPGDSAPSSEESRVHPIFQTGGGPPLVVSNEVPEKGYLRTGAFVAGIKRKQRMDRLDTRLAAQIRSLREGTHPATRTAEERLRRRGTRGFRGL